MLLNHRRFSGDSVFRLLFGLSIVLCLINPATVQAATYYVDVATGSDAYNATQAQNPATPWQTISHAAGEVPAGSSGTPNVIEVAGGVYDSAGGESFPIDMAAADVSVVGAGAATTIIDGGGTTTMLSLSNKGITVQGFTFVDATTAIDALDGGFTVTENVFSNDPDFDIGTAVDYSFGVAVSSDWAPGDIEIIDNDMNVSVDGVHIDISASGNDQAVNLDLGSMTIEDNVIRATGSAGGIDIDSVSASHVNGGSVTIGAIILQRNTVVDGGDSYCFAGSLTHLTDTTVTVGQVDLIHNSSPNSSGTAILVDHYDISTWSGTTTGTLGRVLLSLNNVINYAGGAIVISGIGPWQYLSGNASVVFNGLQIANNNHVRDFVSTGVTINYNDISYLSGDATASVGPLSVTDFGTIVAPVGLDINIANVGWHLSDQAAVTMGDVTISGNPFDTNNECLDYDQSRTGYTMSGGSSFEGGQLIVTGNTIDSATSQGAWFKFSSIGDNIGDTTTVESGGMDFRGNTVISPTAQGFVLYLDEIGESADGSSQVTFGDVLIGGPEPADANSFTTGGGVQVNLTEVARNMDGLATLDMGEIRIENNTIASNSHGIDIFLDDYDSVGYGIDGDVVAQLPDFTIIGNTIDHGATGVVFKAGGHGEMGTNAALRHGAFTVMNNLVGLGGGSTHRGVYYQLSELAYYSVEDASSITLANLSIYGNEFGATTQDCIAIEMPYLGYDHQGTSSVDVANIAVTENQIGATRSAVLLTIGTYGKDNGAVTVGNISILGNAIPATETGHPAIAVEVRMNPESSAVATIGQTDIEENVMTGISGDVAIDLELIDNVSGGATGTLGQTTVGHNSIDGFGYGVRLTEWDGVHVIGNAFSNLDHAIHPLADSEGHMVAQNDFVDTIAGISNLAATMVDAEDNWWGDNGGPSDNEGTIEVPPCTASPADEVNNNGIGAWVHGAVDYCPWATEDYSIPIVHTGRFESGTFDGWDTVVQ